MIILAYTAHRELVRDSGVVEASGIFRKEADSFLHISTFILISGFLSNPDTLLLGGALEEEGSERVGACSVPTLAVDAALFT